MIETNDRIRSRIEASMRELTARLGQGGTGEEQALHRIEAMEAVAEQGIDLLDRVGWFHQVDQITEQEDVQERFKSVAELFIENGDALLNDAMKAELEEEFEVDLALLRFLSEVGVDS
ncbi:MAG: hypothetical protein V2A76_19415 [Planctomycetota bacterium]